MAPSRKRKRQQAGDVSPLGHPQSPLAKRIKTRSELELDAWTCWKYPPEFWDRLSSLALTSRALEELSRRTSLAQHPAKTVAVPRDLARFARHGGPDLCDLRGYREPPATHRISAAMSSSKSSQSRRTNSTNPPSTLPTSVTTKSKKSTPYNRDFDLHLTDHGVYAIYSSQKPDLVDVKKALPVARASLSPSKFSDGAFESFQEKNARAKDEDDVLVDVIPTILGASQTSNPSARNTVFGNLKPLTDGTIAPAKPDIYYGAHPEDLLPSVRNELGPCILPSTMHDKPMAPNVFVEVKGPDGSAAVATRQARYDGAVGSRAMHSLQNYGREKPQYDSRPYTFSSTYQNDTLKLYAHHLTAPTTEGGQPKYHMTQLTAHAMTNDRETYVQGATAFRNVRDLAKQFRDSFVQAANAKEVQAAVTGPTSRNQRHEEDSSEEFVDCIDYPLPDTPDEHALEITDTDGCSHGSALPELGDTATSFTSSFTSGFTANSTKRARQPLGPDSRFVARSPPSKSRHPPGTNRRIQKPAFSDLSPADETGHLWVTTS